MQVKVAIQNGIEEAVYNVKKALYATLGIEIKDKKLSVETILRLALSQDSPIQQLRIESFAVVPERVHTHFVRHGLTQHYVLGCRPDRPNDYALMLKNKNERYMYSVIDFSTLMHIFRYRLCMKAWKDTREFFQLYKEQLAEIFPELAVLLQAVCVWYGFCPMTKQGCTYIKNNTAEREELLALVDFLTKADQKSYFIKGQ
jgi:thymidylate synthase ThyX